MKKLILGVILSAAIMPAFSQVEEQGRRSKKDLRRERIDAISKQEEEGVIKYRKHTVAGAKLTSDGYGGFIEIGRAQSVRKSLLFQLEITERKHRKEEKQEVAFSATTPVIFGKMNFFYPVKLGVQQQFLLGNKGNKNGVSVTGNIGGGVVVGLLRPYMIEVQKNGSNESVSYYTDSVSFLDRSAHVRGPGFGKGWKSLKVTPGIYLKPALRFDYGKYNEMVNAIEVGLIAEYYSKEIDQMVYQEKDKFFFSAFVSIMFGRRK